MAEFEIELLIGNYESENINVLKLIIKVKVTSVNLTSNVCHN